MKAKKYLAGIFLGSALFGAIPYNISQNLIISSDAVYYTGLYGELKYKKYNDHIEIIACSESATDVSIPGKIDNKSVTSIGSEAFCKCTGLTSVYIPDSVISIGENAFSGCTGLTSVTIPRSVESLEEFAFSECTGLTYINIPGSIQSIGESAFYNCTGLLKVNISSGVELIRENAFSGCSGLESLTIPYSVKFIREGAFSDCSSLTSINIPVSINLIRENTFSGCLSLTSIDIPESVVSIRENAFADCPCLEKITIKNPDCIIYGNGNTISSDIVTVYGYKNSTAQTYAEKYDKAFVALEDIPTNKPAISGDANGDGKLDIADVVAVASYVGDPESNLLDSQSIINCDVHNTGDGLTSGDILMIQQYISDIIKEL